MNTLLSADYIVPVTHPPVKNGVLEITGDGTIVAVHSPDSRALAHREVYRHRGIIVPGFVNAHCHLELSHMLGVIPKHTGLVPFLLAVMRSRTAGEDAVLQAMEAADRQMAANGIVAVGDHANNGLSATIKHRSSLHYHTFVETIGVEPELAAEKLRQSRATAESFDANRVSITAHAPYSVSGTLFALLDGARDVAMPLSIHNQESAAENDFFRDRSGVFLDFYHALSKDISGFASGAETALRAYVPHLGAQTPLLLVHNTFSVAEDIRFVAAAGREVTWCLCPNANLYIEGTLPHVPDFIRHDQRIALGTDSLASNDQLCMLSELRTLHEHFPELPFTETIKWATINGASALRQADRYGSFEKGKRPGINLLMHTDGLAITPETTVHPL
ncbi:amidohydrolase family protein [Parapedobacter lycopersici]|uniref:amidohydrolase family protein n=1 Tax=Parapedobacter lycopersici TaxID=1864939 RepID=UPI003340F584